MTTDDKIRNIITGVKMISDNMPDFKDVSNGDIGFINGQVESLQTLVHQRIMQRLREFTRENNAV